MASLKRLAKKKEYGISIDPPLNSEEIAERKVKYKELEPKRFSRRYNELLYRPVTFTMDGKRHEIQYNFCTNPYCKWHGLSQEKFENVKSKPSRYRLSGRGEDRTNRIICNDDPIGVIKGMTWGCTSTPVSNWSIAEEINRLVRINTVKDIEPDYEFHKENCPQLNLTPFCDSNFFYKQGKSKTGAQVWQCKSCKKKTSMLPTRRQSTTYHQKRNDILPSFTRDILNRTPVTRTCEKLKIGVSTYYNKLEWVYRRCLEFLERHETQRFAQMTFKEMWLNTDKMIYSLNNVRKKGQGGKEYDDIEESQFPTHIVVTADIHSLYVLRSDVAYDWDVDLEDIRTDTAILKEDHLSEFCRKNARFRDKSYYPQPPSEKDTQTKYEFKKSLVQFERRGRYVEGLHVNSTYTTIAHLFLIKQLVNASEWRFVTDKDYSLLTAYSRVFSKEIRLSNAHHFICLVDRSKTLKQCYREYKEGRADLYSWGASFMYDTRSIWQLGLLKLQDVLEQKTFSEEVKIGNDTYLKWAEEPVEHPIPTKDKGFFDVDCKTDLSSLEPAQIAQLVLNVSDFASNAFIQQIRRRLSILERPLVTARGDGKSYIYANFNPKYAQYSLTILRTFYNFCELTKGLDGQKLTPAQRLGLVDKAYSIEDILYLR